MATITISAKDVQEERGRGRKDRSDAEAYEAEPDGAKPTVSLPAQRSADRDTQADDADGPG